MSFKEQFLYNVAIILHPSFVLKPNNFILQMWDLLMIVDWCFVRTDKQKSNIRP